ncbi:hypothetical protein ACFXTI_014455 [Malus domestica]
MTPTKMPFCEVASPHNAVADAKLNATKMPSSKSLVQNLFKGIWERVLEWRDNSARGWSMMDIQRARQA